MSGHRTATIMERQLDAPAGEPQRHVSFGPFQFDQELGELTNKGKRAPLTDGVEWVQTRDAGIVAASVEPNSAAGRKGVFGIMPGDRLVAVSLDEKTDEQVGELHHIQVALEVAGVGGDIRYFIERPTNPEEVRFYHLHLDNLTPAPTWGSRDLYINLVGIVYLLVGLFVLFRQGATAPFVRHFMVLCLAAFVFHFYKPYGSYEDFDLFISFLDETALTVFAPVEEPWVPPIDTPIETNEPFAPERKDSARSTRSGVIGNSVT
mgnify:CR=1 FL=1